MAESSRAANKAGNEQSIVRVIRKAVIHFDSTDDQNEKMKSIMALSAIGALSLISNRQMIQSTARFIEAKLGI
jgi:hypothetical protein